MVQHGGRYTPYSHSPFYLMSGGSAVKCGASGAQLPPFTSSVEIMSSSPHPVMWGASAIMSL